MARPTGAPERGGTVYFNRSIHGSAPVYRSESSEQRGAGNPRAQRPRSAVTVPLWCVAALVASVHTGCSDTPLDAETGFESQAPPLASGELDEDAILASLARFRSSPDFVRVNGNPYPSALDPEKLVNLYVSTGSHEAYARIAPESAGSESDVPEGTLIVREIQQPIGQVTSLTLMYKGPPGYNPALNDFWFGVTDPFRTPVEEDGLRMVGEIEDCYGCHLARSEDGYLFGVPATNRASR